jgi:hypothetical protein
MTRGYGQTIGIAAGGAMKKFADSQVQEGAVFSAGVTQRRLIFVNGHRANSQLQSGSLNRIYALIL